MSYPISDDKLPLAPIRAFVAGDWRHDAPEIGILVTAYAEDRHGAYVLPFRCVMRESIWRNANSGEALAVEVKGWRV